jgi:hypothetical protein
MDIIQTGQYTTVDGHTVEIQYRLTSSGMTRLRFSSRPVLPHKVERHAPGGSGLEFEADDLAGQNTAKITG